MAIWRDNPESFGAANSCSHGLGQTFPRPGTNVPRPWERFGAALFGCRCRWIVEHVG